jgi:very-short-patch-repair endonuclease
MCFGRSAAWLWGLVNDRAPAGFEIVVSPSQRPRLTGVTVHRFADVDRTAPVRRRGVPTTNPLRTVIDLGAVAPPDTVMAAVETGHRNGILRMPAVVGELERVARRGRDGCGVLREVLDHLNVLGSWTPSRLETKARELFRRAGLPEPKTQVVWGRDGEYRLDFYWPDLQLVVEVDGWSFHASSGAHAHDLRRQNKLVLAGVPPLRYSWADIVQDGRRVVAELRAFKPFS